MSIRNELLEDILAASSPSAGFDPAESMAVNLILETSSVAIAQDPIGLGVANSRQIEFGPATGTGADLVMLDAAGVLTINQAGLYSLSTFLQFGRNGTSGESNLLFRASDVLGNQLGRTISFKLDSLRVTDHLSSQIWINAKAGTQLVLNIMRDAAGDNSGGLIMTKPSPEAGQWDDAATATLRVHKWSLPPGNPVV